MPQVIFESYKLWMGLLEEFQKKFLMESLEVFYYTKRILEEIPKGGIPRELLVGISEPIPEVEISERRTEGILDGTLL